MTTDQCILYVRNSFRMMLNATQIEYLWAARVRSESLAEAFCLAGSLDWQIQKELDKEAEAVYDGCSYWMQR